MDIKEPGLPCDMQRPAVTTCRDSGVTVLWTASDGVRCVIATYDETRYQLRLLRQDGTVKADLFSNYSQALATSLDWRSRFRDSDRTEV